MSHGFSHISRREFLKLLGAAPAFMSTATFPFIASCRKAARTPSYDQLLREVEKIHSARASQGSFPQNPVSIVWNPDFKRYPNIKQVHRFRRESSTVYAATEKAMMLLNPENPENPLSKIISPGDVVTIKPNWGTQYYFPVCVTHSSLLTPIVDYCVKAGAREIRIAEGPSTLNRTQTYFWGGTFLNIPMLLDELSSRHRETLITFKDGNDDDFTWVSLGEDSEFHGEYRPEQLSQVPFTHDCFVHNMFFDAADSKGINPKRYTPGLYAIANSFLDCDVFINVPKLKTHGMTGITAALKNLMGTTVRSTVHLLSEEAKAFYFQGENKKKYRESPLRDVPHFISEPSANWQTDWTEKKWTFENDILWRSLADLNKIILYADKRGVMRKTRQRRYLTVMDGLIGVERNGPNADTIVKSRVVLAGFDPVMMDAACCKVMGWNPSVLNLLSNCDKLTRKPLGTFRDFENSLIGEPPESPVFKQFFQPPDSYTDEAIRPFSVRAKV